MLRFYKKILHLLMIQAFLTSSIKAVERRGGLYCSEPWVEICKNDQQVCLLFNKMEADWDTARAKCQEEGGDLAVLESTDIRYELMTYMKNHTILGQWYLGGNDRDGYWRWINGDRIEGGWAIHQPNEDQGDDTCNYMNLNDFGFWDTPCVSPFNALCQKS